MVLVLLGIALSSVDYPGINLTFVDTLTQIGLGYFPLFLLARVRSCWQWPVIATILIGYWAAFALYPLPEPDFDYPAVGVPADWPHLANGFAAHWNKNSNLGWAFNVWLLNLFPRAEPWAFSQGGYTALNFIPTLGTMVLGLIAGRWMQQKGVGMRTAGRFALAGLFCVMLGTIADRIGVCPIVKRIWTPSWVLFSGGSCFQLLAGISAVVDVARFRTWAFPLQVIGVNSIAAYCVAHLTRPFVISSLNFHFGSADAFGALSFGVGVLFVYWLIMWGMYRSRVRLRI